MNFYSPETGKSIKYINKSQGKTLKILGENPWKKDLEFPLVLYAENRILSVNVVFSVKKLVKVNSGNW